jgi:hypothetical protein
MNCAELTKVKSSTRDQRADTTAYDLRDCAAVSAPRTRPSPELWPRRYSPGFGQRVAAERAARGKPRGEGALTHRSVLCALYTASALQIAKNTAANTLLAAEKANRSY